MKNNINCNRINLFLYVIHFKLYLQWIEMKIENRVYKVASI